MKYSLVNELRSETLQFPEDTSPAVAAGQVSYSVLQECHLRRTDPSEVLVASRLIPHYTTKFLAVEFASITAKFGLSEEAYNRSEEVVVN